MLFFNVKAAKTAPNYVPNTCTNYFKYVSYTRTSI